MCWALLQRGCDPGPGCGAAGAVRPAVHSKSFPPGPPVPARRHPSAGFRLTVAASWCLPTGAGKTVVAFHALAEAPVRHAGDRSDHRAAAAVARGPDREGRRARRIQVGDGGRRRADGPRGHGDDLRLGGHAASPPERVRAADCGRGAPSASPDLPCHRGEGGGVLAARVERHTGALGWWPPTTWRRLIGPGGVPSRRPADLAEDGHIAQYREKRHLRRSDPRGRARSICFRPSGAGIWRPQPKLARAGRPVRAA